MAEGMAMEARCRPQVRISLPAAIAAMVVFGLNLEDRLATADEPRQNAPPWANETPQRMRVGVIRDGVVIGLERTSTTHPHTTERYDIFDWYQGDFVSGQISPLWLYSDHAAGRTRVIRPQHGTGLRRWGWAHGQFWFAFEALYGAIGPHGCSFLQTIPASEVDLNASLTRDRHRHSGWNEESGEFTATFPSRCYAYGEEEGVERLSTLDPLRRQVERALSWSRKYVERSFSHPIDGFDIVPQGENEWRLFMTVEHSMQIWDCRWERTESEEGEEICNHWKLRSEFWVPWRGPFFVVQLRQAEPGRHDHLLVRDTGELFGLRMYPFDGEWHGNPVIQGGPPNTYHEGGTWHGEQVLDPVDYLIAIVYVEPDHRVYGFGPSFYVRLDKWAGRLEKKPCRDVTRGDAIHMDEDGTSRELGEPFRTIWQCALVLKEEGVLDDVSEVEGGPEGQGETSATVE